MKYLSLHQNIVTKVSACRDVGTFDYYILSYISFVKQINWEEEFMWIKNVI